MGIVNTANDVYRGTTHVDKVMAGATQIWAYVAPEPNTLIADVTLGAAASSFDITSIPGTYRSLLLAYSLRTSPAATLDNFLVSFNGDVTNANYDGQYMRGAATAASAFQWIGTRPSLSCTADSAPANHFGTGSLLVPLYTSINFKWALDSNLSWYSRSAGDIRSHIIGWASTATINRITITPVTGPNFVAGSRVSLYGVS